MTARGADLGGCQLDFVQESGRSYLDVLRSAPFFGQAWLLSCRLPRRGQCLPSADRRPGLAPDGKPEARAVSVRLPGQGRARPLAGVRARPASRTGRAERVT